MAEFDRRIDRRGTYSAKWDKYQGRDVLPFWVADMDFAAPQFILDALADRVRQGVLGYTRTPEPLVDAFCEWLRRNRVAEDGAFEVAAPKDILLRMLNNVRMTVARRGDHVRALDFSDYQLMIVPDAYGLYVERADAWLRLKAPEMAADELDKAAAHAPDQAMRDRLRERGAQARRTKSAIH